MTKDGKKVMDEHDISRALKRIAHEIVEDNKGVHDLVFVGIVARGVPIAQRLAKIIQHMEGSKDKIPVGGIDISLYRDDLATKGKYIKVRKSSIPFAIDGETVILVDDVLFHGRTIRAALDGLKDYGRSGRVRLAVLVDRGHRELPIQPDYVGIKVPTTKKEDISVKLLEVDGIDEVQIG